MPSSIEVSIEPTACNVNIFFITLPCRELIADIDITDEYPTPGQGQEEGWTGGG